MVVWRGPKIRKQQGLTVDSAHEAETLKRLLDANGQSFEIAQQALMDNRAKIPTVGEVIQEHIDLLIRPSSGTVKTYQTMLDLHVKKVIGHVPVDRLDYRIIAYWVKSMMAKGCSPQTIKNVHGLISASMNTAEMLGYITRNPCRGVQLPSAEKAEDELMFLTHAEFGLIMDGMGVRYRDFTNFLVMTGTRFGEATALTVADIDLLRKPATARINKAFKLDGQNQFYIGPTKTGAGKRTIGLNPGLVDLLIPLVAGRLGGDLLFTTRRSRRWSTLQPAMTCHWTTKTALGRPATACSCS
ncbi:site-specific integrase [Arthrobacter sp. cf158]|uniref:tyrosine-type recombinase/integrase n=1 Tax=Arthrobacter sp. cf158 TaxID=1761744 RepID=UPI0020C86290|nr:site-specific integrase [Arthrobacter sp. cf158]